MNDIDIELELGNLNSISIDNNDYEQMFNDLIQVDGFTDYLKETMALDIKRHFKASQQQQDLIKGHYQFASYLLEVIKKFAEKKTLTNK